MKANNPGNVDISKTTPHIEIINNQIVAQEKIRKYFVDSSTFKGFLGQSDMELGTPIELYAAMVWMEATDKFEAMEKLNNRKVY